MIPRVGVVALQQGQYRRAGEFGIEPVLRTGRIAEQTVDALRELVILVHLCRCLAVGALGRCLWSAGDDPGLDAFELGQKVALVHGQVAHHRKVRQWGDLQAVGVVVAQEGGAAQYRQVVDHHAAAAAHGHPARPAEAEAAVQVVLDVLQPVEHRHVVGERYLVGAVMRLAVFVGVVALALDGDDPRAGGGIVTGGCVGGAAGCLAASGTIGCGGAARLAGLRVVVTLVGQGVPRGFVTDPPQDGLGEAGKCGGRHGPNLFISGRFSCLGFGVWRCTAVVSCRGVPRGLFRVLPIRTCPPSGRRRHRRGHGAVIW